MSGLRIPRPLAALVRSPTGGTAFIVCLAVAALAIVAPQLYTEQAAVTDVVHATQVGGPGHPFGTDSLGRDIFLRTLVATRLSLGMATAAVALAVLAGGAVGLLVAAAGRRLRRVGAVAIDVTLTFPDILLAVVAVAIFGVGVKGAILAVAAAFAPSFARLTFTLAASIAGLDYVAAARATGVGPLRVLGRYILPNVADSLTVLGFSALGQALIAISSLSFLGLAVQPPDYDWGSMLTEGLRSVYLTPAAAIAPAAMIAGTGLALALLGDAVARAVNPMLWSRPTPSARRLVRQR